MPGPPPPPPGPPPPPAMGALGPVKKPSASGSGDNRGALLSQIQKGTQLKKVKTVDKSGPAVAGKIKSESSAASSPSRSRGLPSSNKSSPDSSTSSPVSSSSSKQGGFASLTDELQHKLTLKKNKQSPVKEVKHVSESKESSPPSISSNSFVNEIKAKQSLISPQHHSQLTSTSSNSNNNNVTDAIPNKSSLFSNNNNSNKNQPTLPFNAPPKINHGKPNLAPKPPPQLSLPVSNNNNNNNVNSSSIMNDNSRKSVARHQSMKSPRSPPIASSPSGPFNSDNHFGTMRNPSSKIQDALNLQVSVQKPTAQRPTNKPPPPPVPNRNLSNSKDHAKSTTAINQTASDQSLNAPRRIPYSGSSSNINMDKGVDSLDSSAPPLPPHRLSSSHRAQQQQQALNNSAPPEVPKRHSSMRNSVENGGGNLTNNNNRYPSPNPNQPITRLVVDLEARYSLLFHSISEFPAPKEFMNVEKSYPSRAIARPTNGI